MAENERQLTAAWAHFLGGYAWDHMATLTTRHPLAGEALGVELRDRFIRRLAKAAQRRVGWFPASELTHVGRPHLHVLLGGTAALTTQQLEKAWRAGHSRMTKLNGQEEAVRYVVKELGRFPDTFDVSRIWVPSTQTRPRMQGCIPKKEAGTPTCPLSPARRGNGGSHHNGTQKDN